MKLPSIIVVSSKISYFAKILAATVANSADRQIVNIEDLKDEDIPKYRIHIMEEELYYRFRMNPECYYHGQMPVVINPNRARINVIPLMKLLYYSSNSGSINRDILLRLLACDIYVRWFYENQSPDGVYGARNLETLIGSTMEYGEIVRYCNERVKEIDIVKSLTFDTVMESINIRITFGESNLAWKVAATFPVNVPGIGICVLPRIDRSVSVYLVPNSPTRQIMEKLRKLVEHFPGLYSIEIKQSKPELNAIAEKIAELFACKDASRLIQY